MKNYIHVRVTTLLDEDRYMLMRLKHMDEYYDYDLVSGNDRSYLICVDSNDIVRLMLEQPEFCFSAEGNCTGCNNCMY